MDLTSPGMQCSYTTRHDVIVVARLVSDGGGAVNSLEADVFKKRRGIKAAPHRSVQVEMKPELLP